MRRGVTLRLAALALGVLLAPSQAAAVEVRLDFQGPVPPREGEIVVGAGAQASASLHSLKDGLVLELPAQPAAATVTCRGEGLWCPEVVLAGDAVTLPIFATMTISGRVSGARAQTVPSEGTVQGVVALREQGLQPIEFRETVTLEADGPGASFTLTAPRADLDLRFAFPGAAPVYRWGIEPPAPDAPAVHLGTLALHPGGSLSGWAMRQEDELPVAGAHVVASPVTGGGVDGELPLHTWRGITGERGFFQIQGLRAGAYRLELSAEGRVPRVLQTVEVEQAAETVVGAVLLTAPLHVSVQITPPRHPNGRPWTVVFSPVRPLPREEPLRVVAGDDGVAKAAPLRPAEYYLKVQSSEGEDLHFAKREISADAWLALEVPIVEVEGTVRLGGETIAATVKLETGDGDQVQLASDEEGELHGWMRRPERSFLLATVTWSEGEEQRRRTVKLVPEVDDDVVALEIDLPAGAVHGEVVDSEGRPQRRARVRATPAAGATMLTEVEGRTDESGRFHLTGLDRARYLLQAGGNGSPASEVVAVDLAGGLPADSVRLVVWPTREVTLQVTADGQGVAGANVSLDALGSVPVSIESSTDGQGVVAFDLPETVERAVVTVFAPSRLLWSACLPIEGERMPLALPATPPGELMLTLTGRRDRPPADGQMVLLTSDGGFVPYGVLMSWNRLREAERNVEIDGEQVVQVLRIPALPPAGYAVAWTAAPTWELAARACAGAFPRLDWSALLPGGRIDLSLDLSGIQANDSGSRTGDASR